ncbi:MAG: nickel pincer cofactor biosynthesis protein LarC [Desulfocapsa sp.]|nr:MAG: nickel pincer cofactor biosynthesis protein LarC [Desulfocapsa sp.]
MAPPVTCCYLDCFSGISGDMLLGAFLHAGLPQDQLISRLKRIPNLDFEIQISQDQRSGIGCYQIHVHSKSEQQFRHLNDILGLLNDSSLTDSIKNRASGVFTRLAVAEAKVHNVDMEKIHFHEVGAVDTIVDVVGTLIALDYFNITELICSPLPMGRGFVNCAHGRLPLPAPAVCELLKDIPVYGVAQDQELVTPTGAVLAACLADSFGSIPSMNIKQTGYGAGNNQLKNKQPNLLRLLIGQKEAVNEAQSVEIIECNLDDWNTEMFPYLSEKLFAGGALDVSLSPLLMKKGRPGQQLQVICPIHQGLTLRQIIFSETSAIGLRFRHENRMTLTRKTVNIPTQWGNIAAKEVQKPQGVVIYPEYEACKKVAQAEDIPLPDIYNAVIQAGEKKTNG